MDKGKFQQAKQNPLKLLIGVPTRGELKADMALCLGFLLYTIASKPIITIDGEPRFVMWQVQKVVTSNLCQSRQNLVDMALAEDVDFLLFIDDDMNWDMDLVYDWLLENRPVIAANCPTRSIPCYPTARQKSERHPFKGELVYSDIAKMRWERVWRVGTGIMMLRKDALRKLPRPAFTIRWEPGNDAYVGEDWVLCEHLEATGTPIIIDNKHSLSVGHIGDMEFRHEMVAGTRQKIAKESGIIIPEILVPKKEELPHEQN